MFTTALVLCITDIFIEITFKERMWKYPSEPYVKKFCGSKYKKWVEYVSN